MKKTLSLSLSLSLALALLMVISVTASVYAAPEPTAKITGMAQNLSAGFYGNSSLGDIAPQDKLVAYIYLTDNMFTWDNHVPDPDNPIPVSANQLHNARVDVRTSNKKSTESITLNASRSRIEVKFLTELVSTKELEFEFDVILTIGGQRQSDYSMNFDGILKNPLYEIFADDEYEDISDGEIVEAQEYVKSITLEIGAGVTLNTRMSKNERIYAVATEDLNDDDVFDEYKEAISVINIKSSGIPKSATVFLDNEFKDYYAYDAEGKFIGRGNAELPISSKYYFFVERLAASPEKLGVANAPDEPSPAQTTETDSNLPSTRPNINFNPNTGR